MAEKKEAEWREVIGSTESGTDTEETSNDEPIVESEDAYSVIPSAEGWTEVVYPVGTGSIT